MGACTARPAAPGGGSAVHGSAAAAAAAGGRSVHAESAEQPPAGSGEGGPGGPAAAAGPGTAMVPHPLQQCIPIASLWSQHPCTDASPLHLGGACIPCSNTSPLHPHGACIPAPTHSNGASIPAPMHPHCISVVPTSPAAMHQSCIPMVPASLHQCIPTVPACPHKCTPIASLWFQHPCTNASPAATHPRRTPRTNASLPPSCTDAAQLQRERQTPHPPLPSPAAAAADGGKGMQAADRALGAWDGRCWHRGTRVCRGGAGGGKETSGRAAGLSNAGAAPRHLDCPGNGGRGGGREKGGTHSPSNAECCWGGCGADAALCARLCLPPRAALLSPQTPTITSLPPPSPDPPSPPPDPPPPGAPLRSQLRAP